MVKKRIGNDVRIRWTVFNPDMSPVDFSSADVKVEIRNAGYSKSRHPQQVTIDGNKIDFQFTAKEQESVGVYDLWLQFTKEDPSIEGGTATVTIDHCGAFQLVAKSCQLPENDDPVVVQGIISGLSYSNLTQDEKDEITLNLANSGYWSKINVVDTLPETGVPGEFYATVEVV